MDGGGFSDIVKLLLWLDAVGESQVGAKGRCICN